MNRTILVLATLAALSGCRQSLNLYPGPERSLSEVAELNTGYMTIIRVDEQVTSLSRHVETKLFLLPGSHTVTGYVSFGMAFGHTSDYDPFRQELPTEGYATSFEARAGKRYKAERIRWSFVNDTVAAFRIPWLVIRDRASEEIVSDRPPGEDLPWVWADSAFSMYAGPVRPAEETALLMLDETVGIWGLRSGRTSDGRRVRCGNCIVGDVPINESGERRPFDRFRLLPGQYQIAVRYYSRAVRLPPGIRSEWTREPILLDLDLKAGQYVMISGTVNEDRTVWTPVLVWIETGPGLGR